MAHPSGCCGLLLAALLHGAAALAAEPRRADFGRDPQLTLQDRYDLLQDQYRHQQQREVALRRRLALLQEEPQAAVDSAPQEAAEVPMQQEAVVQEAPQMQEEAVVAPQMQQEAAPQMQQEAVVSDPHAPAASFSSGGLSTYKLRLCNAFAWAHPLEMSRVQEPQLVEYPLPYKACHDYLLPLQEGDELQFNAGGQRIGSFAVRSLPEETGSLLLIVPHRRDRESTAVAFESHIFKTNSDAQVAVIDVYRGPEKSTVMIGEGGRREELPFDSVVALAPGSYPFALQGADHLSANKRRAAAKSSSLVAKKEENYCILRVGMGDDSFPEELVMFPWSGASRTAVPAALFAVLASYFLTLA